MTSLTCPVKTAEGRPFSTSQSAQVVSPEAVRTCRSSRKRQQDRKPVWPTSSRQLRTELLLALPFRARRLWTEQTLSRPPEATRLPDGAYYKSQRAAGAAPSRERWGPIRVSAVARTYRAGHDPGRLERDGVALVRGQGVPDDQLAVLGGAVAGGGGSAEPRKASGPRVSGPGASTPRLIAGGART